MPGDVLEEDPERADFADDPRDVRPEVAGIVLSAALPGHGERLAGIPGSEEMNSAAERAAVEGSEIRPHNRWSQGLLFHARRQDGARECFDLHVTDDASASKSQLDAEIETGSTRGEREDAEIVCGVRIHTVTPRPSRQDGGSCRDDPMPREAPR